MALLKDFGRSDNDLGLWFAFGEDVPALFELRIRRIPYDVQNMISKRYGREQIITSEGVRYPHMERTLEESTNWLLDQAIWAWTGVRENAEKPFTLEVGDEDGVKLWSRLLKRDVFIGQEFEIHDADLSADVKRRILTQIRPFASMTDAEAKKQRVDLGTFIVIKQALMAADASKAVADARGN